MDVETAINLPQSAPIPPAIVDDVPGEGTPASADPSTGPTLPPKRKGGWPKGRPRKSRPPPSAPGSATGEQRAQAPRPGPFAEPPPGATGPAVPPPIVALLPPDQLAAVAVNVGAAVCAMLASKRYGDANARAAFTLAKEEQEVLVPLTAEYLKTMQTNLTPGEALALALVAVIGGKVGALEMQRAEEKRRERENVAP